MQLAPLGGGFRPGTRILIEGSHEVPIEDDLEGLKPVIYVDHGFVQLGECSDEAIVSPTGSGDRLVDLWGFNNESPFFSANAVFHTPAGPCAIDPESAMRVNHWNRVLKLEAGRYVYWFDGQIYREIRIERLICQKADCVTLHRLHLREGLRSYHVNGFLALPRHNQRPVLSHLVALQPLLTLFGADARTLAAALTRYQISSVDDELNISEASSTSGQPTGDVSHPIYTSRRAIYQSKDEEYHGRNLWLGTHKVLPRTTRRNDDALRLGRYMVEKRSVQVGQRVRKKRNGHHDQSDQGAGKTRVLRKVQSKRITRRRANPSITKTKSRGPRQPRSAQNNQVTIKIE
ncbi:hypothetical protein MMC17_006777 [Xylographa soralifera]|nr:hypothetical protein [Xylographa soralifera]